MKINKILIILIIILLFTIFLTYNKMNHLENKISNLSISVYMLEDQISRISGDISRSLNDFRAENSWTRKTRAQATHYNEEDRTATVKVEVEFNELRNGEKIHLYVQDSEGNPLDTIDVTPVLNNSLNLDYTLDLSIDHDYALSLVGESAESKRSIDLGDIILKSTIRKFLIVDSYGRQIEYDENDHYKSVEIDIFINSILEKDDFMADYFTNRSIVDLYGEVYVDDVLYDTVDFLHDNSWNLSGIELEGENEKADQAIRSDNTVPVFEFGTRTPDDLNISGVYTFKEPVASNQEVTFFIIFKDSQGDEYRYPLAYIFS